MTKGTTIIGYPGNKANLTGQVFAVLPDNCSELTYVDPFFGGGGAYLNLPREFRAYECSDILPHAVDFFAQEYTAEYLQVFENRITERCDLDIKENYYSFRDHWNRAVREGTHFNFAKIGFVLLAHHCVNHLVRFGPNGFNQGWGGKRGKLGPRWEGYCKARRPNTRFQVQDFRQARRGTDVLLYLDPPYSGTELGIYGQQWTEQDDRDLIGLVRQQTAMGGPWILSSPLVANGEAGKVVNTLQSLGAKVILIDKTYKASVGNHKRKDSQETVVTNIGVPPGDFAW